MEKKMEESVRRQINITCQTSINKKILLSLLGIVCGKSQRNLAFCREKAKKENALVNEIFSSLKSAKKVNENKTPKIA